MFTTSESFVVIAVVFMISGNLISAWSKAQLQDHSSVGKEETFSQCRRYLSRYSLSYLQSGWHGAGG